jgi:hypothetical protein
MSSRQEEKERRRQEREERELAAAAKAKRARLLQLIGGVVVACAIVGGVAFAVSSGGGGGGGDDVDDGALTSAATAGGCVYRAFASEGRDHVTKKLTAANFKTNPPTSGAHNPNPAADGVYAAGNEPAIENWVHTLEHGRVLFQYRPGTSAPVVSQLQKLLDEDVKGSGNGYHSVLMQNNSKMPFQVAAVAWRHSMGCREFTPKSIEALRTFREALVDKAPEKIP